MISKKTTAAVGAGAVAGALGISLAGGAFTADASPAAVRGAGAAHRGHHRGHGGALGEFGRVVHGTGVVKTKTGYETVAVDRGTVTAVSPTAVSIKSADGVIETFTPVATSRYRVDGKKAALTDVKVGAAAGTVAVVNGAAHDIKLLIVRPAKAAATS